MSSIWPAGYDAFRTDHANNVGEDIRAETVNELADAVNKLERGVGPVFSASNYGAVGDGIANDAAALQATYNAIPASGGVMILPPGTYLGSFSMNSVKPVLLIGYGATLKVPINTVGIDVQTGTGMVDRKASVIEGLLIQGQAGVEFDTGNTGIKITNSDWVKVRNCKVQFLNRGIHYLSIGTGWCEASSVENTAIFGCTTGIRYEKDVAAASGSFAECSLRDVGINDCTIAIDASGNNGTGLQRTTFQNVTIWLARTTQIGVKVGCNISGAFWVISFESTMAVTGFNVTTNTANTDLARIFVNWNIGSATKAAVDAGLKLTWIEGTSITTAYGTGTATFAALLGVKSDGDTVNRAELVGGANPGMNLGPGNGAADVVVQRGAASRLDVFADVMHRGTKYGFFGTVPVVKPTVTGSKGANAALTSLLAALAGLGVLTDSST